VKLFVTGCAGRLGTPLVERFAREHEVTGFDIQDPKPTSAANVRHIQGDLRDRDKLRIAAEGAEVVIHLGAIPGRGPHLSQAEIFEINVQGTYHALEAAERVGARRVIMASSLCAVGLPDGLDDHALDYLPLDEEHPCRPKHTYDLTKQLNEKMAAAFTRRTGIATVCFRFPLLADVRNDPWFAKQVAIDPPRLATADYMDFQDAIDAIDLAMNRDDLEHEVFFVHADTAALKIPTPKHIARFVPKVEWQGEITDTSPLINSAKAKRILGFRPKIKWQDGVAELKEN